MNIECLQSHELFQQLLEQVHCEVNRLTEHSPERSTALEHELQALASQIDGWRQSLANPMLSTAVRQDLEKMYEDAAARRTEVERELTQVSATRDDARKLVRVDEVATKLARLGDVLAKDNVTLANLELSQHIASIDCFPGGRVVMKTCKLGALPDVIDFVKAASPVLNDSAEAPPASPTTRRRNRLRVHDDSRDRTELEAAVEFATDPNRFAGVDTKWFWVDEFQVPRRLSWPEEHALEVHKYCEQHRCSQSRLAEHFEKSVPTIRKALQFAEKMLGEQKEKRGQRGLTTTDWESRGIGDQRIIAKLGPT